MIKTEYDSSIALNSWKEYKCIKQIDPKCKGIINFYINGFSADYVTIYTDKNKKQFNIQLKILLKFNNYYCLKFQNTQMKIAL